MVTLTDHRSAEGPSAHIAPRSAGATTARRFRPDIEGLRAVAVLLVVLYHVGVPVIDGGYVGVDVFFVISGFLITGLLLREFDLAGRISLLGFYARRARRILPIATLVLIATMAASSIELSPGRVDSIARDGLWTAVFGANFRFAASGANYLNATGPVSPLQHYWSLAIEEQFYVLWPALLAVGLWTSRRLWRGNRVAILVTGALVVASFVWSIVQTGHDANAAYFSPLTRGWELGVGALIAICAATLVRVPRIAAVVAGWAGLAVIVYSAVRFDSHTVFPGWAAGVPVAGTALVLLGGLTHVPGGAEFVLARRPMQRIGMYSYSLYLWHWPILIIAVGRYPGIGLPAKLALMVGALLLSALTFTTIENPIRRSAVLTRSVWASLALGAALIGVSLIYCNMYVVGGRYEIKQAQQVFAVQNAQAATAGGRVYSTTQIEAAVAAAAAGTAHPAALSPPVAVAAKDHSPAYQDGCLVTAPHVESPACTFGNLTAAKTVVLLGDSHAAAWMPALQNSASRANFKLVVLTKGNCAAPSMTLYSVEYKRPFTECNAWRSWALAKVGSLKPDLVVVASNFHGVQLPGGGGTQNAAVQASWNKGLSTTLSTLRASAGRVVLLGDVASHVQAVPDCVATNQTHLSACNDPIGTAILTTHERDDAATAKAAGVAFVSTRPWFCTATVCPSVVNGIITDFDQNHLTATYAKYLGHALGVAVGLEK